VVPPDLLEERTRLVESEWVDLGVLVAWQAEWRAVIEAEGGHWEGPGTDGQPPRSRREADPIGTLASLRSLTHLHPGQQRLCHLGADLLVAFRTTVPSTSPAAVRSSARTSPASEPKRPTSGCGRVLELCLKGGMAPRSAREHGHRLRRSPDTGSRVQIRLSVVLSNQPSNLDPFRARKGDVKSDPERCRIPMPQGLLTRMSSRPSPTRSLKPLK
jgi:hypothetical protein